jgi:hypothetical protein
VAVALLLALPAGARAAPGWRLLALLPLEEPITLAAFVDERAGVLLGGPWARYTLDGGRTWLDGAAADSARHALEVLPDGFAWHAGVLTVGRSFSYGRTWYPGGNFGGGDPEPAVFLSFADENRGLIAARARLGLTEDGGLRWSSLPLPGWAEGVAAVSLSLAPPPPGGAPPAMVAQRTRRAVVGRVLDTAGRIWVTRDGGETWSFAESPIAGRRFRVAGGVATAALRFTAAGDGVLAAFVEEDGRERLRVFRATRGEAGWTEEWFPLVEEPGALYLSPDGRLLTWKRIGRSEVRLYVREATAAGRVPSR